ncbi:MAG: YdcF family protein [Oscillospiraceae bacterium]|jgi:uncharacterized SAM-binding protein YcdF (DUF218 family)|nr:YdcF family protein [Oscillospiraceae bacterium]
MSRKFLRFYVVFLLLLSVPPFMFGALGLLYGLRLAPIPFAAGVILIALGLGAIPLSRACPRAAKTIALAVTSACVAAFCVAVVACGQILSKYFDEPAPPDAFVIVLGCGLSPADRTTPSKMLTARLVAAKEYLDGNPGASVVLSGGQGGDELVSEARAMFTWLTERGVAPERLILEDKSTNTDENMRFSLARAREAGLETANAVSVTDGFHEVRAHYFARGAGITPYTKSSSTDFGLTAFFWARELGGVIWQVWLGR